MGTILIPYLADASGTLRDLAYDIHGAVLDVEDFYGDHLEQKIDVIFTRGLPEIVIQEDGIGGRAHASTFIEIGLAENWDPSRQSIGEMLCHEVGHAYRWQVRPEERARSPRTFFETATLEGLAIHLEAEFIKHFHAKTFFLETIQNRCKDADFCKSLIEKTRAVWGTTTYDYDMLFFTGSYKLPRWTGYTLGYMFVSGALSQCNLSIFDLVEKPYHFIEYQFNKMLPH